MTKGAQLPLDDAKLTSTIRRILTVTQLTTAIRSVLESNYQEVWLEGEISNCRLWKTGHLYFTLKDRTAQIRAVMFRSTRRYLRFEPEDGLQVVARGRVSVYEPKGEYQIIAEHLEPHGLGALQLAFDQLRQRLTNEGLFDAEHKRPLPALPRKIGIVTSVDGAALRDIIKVLGRRYPNAHLVISPTRVQGEGAARDIVRAIQRLHGVPSVEVIIVGRGGGSIEDLWAFNDEQLARSIAASPVPIISAVGHETDSTISDYVADVRAPTPSAAAELVVTRHMEILGRIDRVTTGLQAAAHAGLERRRVVVHTLETRPGLSSWHARLVLRGRHAGELTHRLTHSMQTGAAVHRRRCHELRLRLQALDLSRQLVQIRSRLTANCARIARGISDTRRVCGTRVQALAGRLETLSPLGVLARGYAVCWNGERTAIVRDSTTVSPGDAVRVTLHNGELLCEVRKHD